MSCTLQKLFTARFPVGYHFTVRPFAVISWTDGGASEGILSQFVMRAACPKKIRPFAATVLYHALSTAAVSFMVVPPAAWGFLWKDRQSIVIGAL